jgi:hypothetical protein
MTMEIPWHRREMYIKKRKRKTETIFLSSISNLLVSIFQDFIEFREFSFLGKTTPGDSFEN